MSKRIAMLFVFILLCTQCGVSVYASDAPIASMPSIAPITNLAPSANVTPLPALLLAPPSPTSPPISSVFYGASVTLTSSATAMPIPSPSPIPTPTPKTHRGITEGDTIRGELTHYCVCLKCCGKTDGITASGVAIRNGMRDPFIASCNWLPLGAIIDIDGQRYTIADRGGRGLSKVGRIDIFTPAGHRAALDLGRQRGVSMKLISLP